MEGRIGATELIRPPLREARRPPGGGCLAGVFPSSPPLPSFVPKTGTLASSRAVTTSVMPTPSTRLSAGATGVPKMSLRNGVLSSRTLAVWSLAAVLLLAAGSRPLQAQGSTTYYFPHLAVGASWQTTITYINYSLEEVTCQTDFLSDHGSPLMVSFAGLGAVVSRTDVLPPGGSVHQETNVDLGAPLAPGWARATCSGPVKASLLYRYRDSAGTPVGEAGVNAAAVPATRFVTFAEQGEGQFGTGVAYANPSATSAHVTFTAKDVAGQTLASVDRTLLPGGHDAHGMSDLFGLTSFTGSLEVTSTEPIVSLSINLEADPVFSSLPPGEVDAADIPGGGNNFGVGDALPGVPTAGQLFPVSGWATEWSGVTFSGTLDNSTTYLTFDDGGYIQLQIGTRYTCRATGGCRVGNGIISRGTIVGSGGTPAPPPGNQPDLVVGSASVSDSSPAAGVSFTLSVIVRNDGGGASAGTTLRYYRSANATITRSDTGVGTEAVGGLAASGTSAESISLMAPSTADTYYYGACVDTVSGESNTANNCSSAVRVTVSAGGDVSIPQSPSVTTRFSPSQLIIGQRAEFVLNWNEVAGATSYKVRVQPLTPILYTKHPDGSCTVPSSVTVHETSYTHKFTAMAFNQFFYAVQACNSAGCSCPR